jgi:polar amino acid transport system permease protein
VALLGGLRRRWVRWPVIVYVDFFRAFPPLVLLIFIYFGLPFLGLDLPAFVAVALTFLLNTSSYYGEIFRAGIESIGRGQTEAARSTGLTRWQTLVYVVVPQAVRNVLPDLIGNTLEVVKLTSLASVVALPELLYAARSAQSVTYNPSPIVLAAAVYFVLLWPGVRVLSRLEHRMLAGRR